MESLTERYPVAGPIVYGYVRLPAAQQTRRRALTRALENYCEQHELLLGGTFTDGGEPVLISPAFGGLLAVLSMNHSYGVITPARTHLGSHGLAIERTDLITQTGRRLMVLRDSELAAGPRPPVQAGPLLATRPPRRSYQRPVGR